MQNCMVLYNVLLIPPFNFVFFFTVGYLKIIWHPESKSVATGKETSFSIGASGDNLHFQWQIDGIDLSDGDKYRGVNTNILRVVNLGKGDKGYYRCLVNNKIETMFSNEALLSVSELLIATSCHFSVHQLARHSYLHFVCDIVLTSPDHIAL